jgi:hypothetical protein
MMLFALLLPLLLSARLAPPPTPPDLSHAPDIAREQLSDSITTQAD